jgi:hypothetical protein
MDWSTVFEQATTVLLPVLMIALSALAGLAIKYIKSWSKALSEKIEASEAEQAAIAALMEGVEKAQESLVIDLKKSSQDGKLTKEERAKALSLAIDHAKLVATGPGLELLKTMSRERAGYYVKQLLSKVSKK